MRVLLSQRGNKELRKEAGIKMGWGQYFKWHKKKYDFKQSLRTTIYQIECVRKHSRHDVPDLRPAPITQYFERTKPLFNIDRFDQMQMHNSPSWEDPPPKVDPVCLTGFFGFVFC